MSFSFGKAKRSSEEENKERIITQKELENKDNAFMFNSFSQDSKFFEKQNLNLVKKEDFEL
jgi:hypothetical protein